MPTDDKKRPRSWVGLLLRSGMYAGAFWITVVGIGRMLGYDPKTIVPVVSIACGLGVSGWIWRLTEHERCYTCKTCARKLAQIRGAKHRKHVRAILDVARLEHPENQYPLRAWLLNERKMVTVIETFHYKGLKTIKGVGDMDGELLKAGQGVHYVVGKDAVELHPTGVWGKRVCSYCKDGMATYQHETEPHRCLTCAGTGYVPAMIYQADVVLFPRLNGAIGIVFWHRNRRGFAIQFDSGCIQGANIYWGSGVASDIVLGSLFEFDKLTKPDGISNEQ